MQLYSWNVNGLRACLEKGFCDFLQQEAPDVLCLQETKMLPEQWEGQADGYRIYWNSAEKKGYAGTAVFTRREPLQVQYDMNGLDKSREGRCIALEFPGFWLVTVYSPNSQRELVRLPFRMEWEDLLRGYLMELDRKKPVVLCGDLNVAHRPIDLKNPKTNRGNAGYSDEERGKFSELLACGFLDSFRTLYPEKTDAYSWWSYKFQSRQKNVGWRIDYFLLSERLRPLLQDSRIHSGIPGSDHCPVSLVLADS
ncbi:MAG: exodeoxyribonuclease III [Clostridia bacterium]|nr:exodeoxyribonuclease III [Clostridia bacterium]MDD7483831.1 exodeoxyribonuclease III [Clostridia bacterium]MDY5558153.1 exodeoxyribonuclease III [Candidatus Heritagella sp.]